MQELINLGKKENIQIEIFKSENTGSSIYTSNEITNKFEIYNNISYRIKSLIDGKSIKITTDNIDNPKEIIKLLKENASISENNDKDTLAKSFSYTKNKTTNGYDDNLVLKQLLSLTNLKQTYPNIITIDSYYDHNIANITLQNSDDVTLTDSNKYATLYIEITINENNTNQNVGVSFYGSKIDFNEVTSRLKEKLEEAIKKAYATSCKTKKVDIILKNNVVHSILNAFNNMYFAESIRKKTSILTDKLGKKVFSDKITIIENPTDKDFPEKRLFDTEGIKTYCKEIIKNGKFMMKLYDKKNALRENTESTGNSFLLNRYIKPGDKSYKELIDKLENGIIIDEVSGIHSGINIVTGDISIQAEGFLVENKKITKAINSIVLSTNIFELLNNVEEVGNDLRIIDSNGGAPSLLINNIIIAGEEKR